MLSATNLVGNEVAACAPADYSSTQAADGDGRIADDRQAVESLMKLGSIMGEVNVTVCTATPSGSPCIDIALPMTKGTVKFFNETKSVAKVSEIKMEIETIEFRSGMDTGIRKSMGRLKCGDVSLERPYQGLDAFYAWFETREHDKRTLWIEFLKPNGADVVRADAPRGAFPKEWTLPAMDAGASTIGIEKITMAAERALQLE